MKYDVWFRNLLVGTFFFLMALEVYAIQFHQYTLSDFFLENIRMRYRVAICAWLVYHFLFEYPSYR